MTNLNLTGVSAAAIDAESEKAPGKRNAIVMLDLETWGKRPSTVVTQIAFVARDRDDPEIVIRRAEEFLPVQPQIDLGRTIDADTIINFWMQADAEARTLMKRNLGDDKQELVALVTSIHSKLSDIVNECGEVEFISRGMDFDFPILVSLFDMCRLEAPWPYYAKSDLRTIMNEAGLKTADVPRPDSLPKHHASSDCEYQVTCLLEARRQMRAVR